MKKTLVASFPKKCTGCELCVLEAQRQLEKIGLEGALIRIFRKSAVAEAMADKPKETYLEFSIDLDPQINSLDLLQLKEICPTGVFEIIELKEENGLTS
ncbi:hypothetical protein ACFL13_01700 [Patescibacteria group bacterium]